MLVRVSAQANLTMKPKKKERTPEEGRGRGSEMSSSGGGAKICVTTHEDSGATCSSPARLPNDKCFTRSASDEAFRTNKILSTLYLRLRLAKFPTIQLNTSLSY